MENIKRKKEKVTGKTDKMGNTDAKSGHECLVLASKPSFTEANFSIFTDFGGTSFSFHALTLKR